MADSERRARGKKKMDEVYAGTVPVPNEGDMAFADIMLEQLFAEVWTREALSQRDRRLLTMGVIAALGERDTFAIQVKASILNGELTPEQVRETLIHLVQYAGYPRVAGLLGPTEQAIAAAEKA